MTPSRQSCPRAPKWCRELRYGHHASKAALNMAGKRLTIDLKDLDSGNSGVVKHTCGENVFDERWVERKTRNSTAKMPRCQNARTS